MVWTGLHGALDRTRTKVSMMLSIDSQRVRDAVHAAPLDVVVVATKRGVGLGLRLGLRLGLGLGALGDRRHHVGGRFPRGSGEHVHVHAKLSAG